MDFEDLDQPEAAETMAKLASVKIPWDSSDVEGWFMEIEMQMELLNIKSQWVKRIIIGNNLPELIKVEVKDLLKVPKSKLTQENKLIYKVLKQKILKLFGKRQGEKYEEACQLVLTGKPSALAKALIELLCSCNPPLQCCAVETVAAMWKKKLHPQVRAAIAGMCMQADLDGVLDKADDV